LTRVYIAYLPPSNNKKTLKPLAMESKEIYDQVNKRYGSVTQSTTGKYEQTIAEAFGYRAEELATIPQDANLGLSCGNPLALAKLTEVRFYYLMSHGANIRRARPSLTSDLVQALMSSQPRRGLVQPERLLGLI